MTTPFISFHVDGFPKLQPPFSHIREALPAEYALLIDVFNGGGNRSRAFGELSRENNGYWVGWIAEHVAFNHKKCLIYRSDDHDILAYAIVSWKEDMIADINEFHCVLPSNSSQSLDVNIDAFGIFKSFVLYIAHFFKIQQFTFPLVNYELYHFSFPHTNAHVDQGWMVRSNDSSPFPSQSFFISSVDFF